MGGLAVDYLLEEAVVDCGVVEKMTEAIGHRFFFGATGGSYRDAASGMWIALDGRVDNADELRADLRVAAVDDAELVLRAYEAWGEDAAARILGDFAFVIGDVRRRRLLCARDVLGVRPFHYFCDGRRFVCGSEIHQLLLHPAVPKRVNEGLVAEALSRDLTTIDETLYAGILRLPPAHIAIVDAGGVRVRRYWAPDPERVERCGSDAEYAARFAEEFRRAVLCRVRPGERAAAELSGGLDSTSVAAVYARESGDQDFQTFSLIFPGWPCDESEYMADAAEFCGLRRNPMQPVIDPDWYAGCAARYRDLPDHTNFHMGDCISERAREMGFGVMLTGLGGDDWFGNPMTYTPGRLARAWLRLRDNPGLEEAGAIAADFARMVGRRVRRHVLGQQVGERRASWVRESFAQQTGLRERVRTRPVEKGRFRYKEQALLAAGLSDAFRLHCLEMHDRAWSRCGVEHRHPFHDRRLIELAIALPPEQTWRHGEMKIILRNAMKGVIPESIRTRQTKAEFSGVFGSLMARRETAEVLGRLEIARAGWVDQARVLEMHAEVMAEWDRGERVYLPHSWGLEFVWGMELWFRAVWGKA